MADSKSETQAAKSGHVEAEYRMAREFRTISIVMFSTVLLALLASTAAKAWLGSEDWPLLLAATMLFMAFFVLWVPYVRYLRIRVDDRGVHRSGFLARTLWTWEDSHGGRIQKKPWYYYTSANPLSKRGSAIGPLELADLCSLESIIDDHRPERSGAEKLGEREQALRVSLRQAGLFRWITCAYVLLWLVGSAAMITLIVLVRTRVPEREFIETLLAFNKHIFFLAVMQSVVLMAVLLDKIALQNLHVHRNRYQVLGGGDEKLGRKAARAARWPFGKCAAGACIITALVCTLLALSLPMS